MDHKKDFSTNEFSFKVLITAVVMTISAVIGLYKLIGFQIDDKLKPVKEEVSEIRREQEEIGKTVLAIREEMVRYEELRLLMRGQRLGLPADTHQKPTE